MRPARPSTPSAVLLVAGALLMAGCSSLSGLKVPTPSMEDTIQVGARIIVDEDAYRDAPPERTDIVLYRDPRPGAAPDAMFVKRIIGLGGEVLEIRNGKVMIDGIAIAEPYLKPGSQMPVYGPELVPPGHFFVMGDNRKLSLDSRRVGPIPDALILGKVVQIFNPGSEE